MLIDKTYFEGLTHIPNVAEPEPNNRSANLLDDVIDIAEYNVLSYAFGRKMWEDFKERFENNTLTDEYEKIIKGTEYTLNGKDYYWEGLTPETVVKTSLLADYAYWLYSTHQITHTTEFGEVSVDVKVGNKVTSTPKVTEAWNRFVSRFAGGHFAASNLGFTPEGNPFWIVERCHNGGYGVNYYGYNANGGMVSLIQFLKDNAADYPLLKIGEGKFAGLEFKNSFGI